PYYDFRKRITNQFQLSQLILISDNWGVSISDVCWRFITDGISKEKSKREEIEALKIRNSK
ncbi:MAG: hypothetical protein WKF91_22210, partial [Segetibacter sp.]